MVVVDNDSHEIWPKRQYPITPLFRCRKPRGLWAACQVAAAQAKQAITNGTIFLNFK